jgi:hypothetical protein
MIFEIGRLHCESCACERLFVVLADAPAQVDPFGCECDVCGYTFGDRGYTVHEVNRDGVRVAISQAVLDRDVLDAAQQRHQAEAAARLLELGSSKARAREEARLKAALDDPDLAARRAVVAAPARGLDPQLAERMLAPGKRPAAKPKE